MRCAVVVAALWSAPLPAEAGAWTREFLSIYGKLGADVWGASGGVGLTEAGVDRAVAVTTSFYGEIGLLPPWPLQLSVYVPLIASRTDFRDPAAWDGVGHATAVRTGDLRVAVQVALAHVGPQVSLGFEAKVPTYRNDHVGEGFGVYRSRFARPGDGQIDLALFAQFGASIPRTPIWVEASIGWRGRTAVFVGWSTERRFVDGLPASLAVGASLPRGFVQLRLDGSRNVRPDDDSRAWVSLTAGGGLRIAGPFGVELRAGGDLVAHGAARGVTGGAALVFEGRPGRPDTLRAR